MKKILVALALAVVANSASALIANSRHDLSSGGYNPAYRGTLSSCQYCHAPHRTNTTVTGAPLWNRTLNNTGFSLYNSTTLNGGGVALNLGANSLTCLSCHDGRTAMGTTYNGVSDTVPVLANNSLALIGTDLRNDHPVGVRYVTAAGLDTVVNVKAAGLRVYGAAGSETVECGSCHDPHDTSRGRYFLRAAQGVICGECHLK